MSRTDSTKYKVRGYNGLLCPTNHVSNDQGYTLPAMNDQQIYGSVQLNRIEFSNYDDLFIMMFKVRSKEGEKDRKRLQKEITEKRKKNNKIRPLLVNYFPTL